VSLGTVTPSATPGTYTFTVTSTEVGGKDIAVTFGGGATLGTVTAAFGSGIPSNVTSTLEAVTSGAVSASGSQGDFHEAKVILKDQSNHPVPGKRVEFTLTGGTPANGYSLITQSNANGEAVLRFVSDTPTDHTATVKAKAERTSSSDVFDVVVKNTTSTYELQFTFEAGQVSQTHSSYALSTGDRVADGQAEHTITITLRNENNQPIGGRATTLHATAAGRSGQGDATVSVFTETAPGTYVATATARAAGIKDVTAWSGTAPSHVTIDPATAGLTTLSFVPGQPDPNQ
jgi:adhesin/invasin